MNSVFAPIVDLIKTLTKTMGLAPNQSVFVMLGLAMIVALLVAMVIWKLLGRSPSQKRQIEELIDRGMLQEAAELYLTQGDYEDALKLFLQAKAFSRAARVCELTGQYQAAGEYHERVQRFADAVEAYKKAGKYDRAGKILVDQGQLLEAAKLYETHGLLAQAASVHQESQQYVEAAQIYLRLENHAQAGEMYAAELNKQIRLIRGQIKPQEWKWLCKIAADGAQAYMRAGQKEKAADLFLKGESFQQAAEIYQVLGQHEKAIEAFKKGGFFDQAAAIYQSLGREHDMHEALGEHYRKKGVLLEAAEHFSKAGNFMAAADLWVQLGERKRAAECFKEAGDYVEAAALYAQLGDDLNAAICFEKAGVYDEAARYHGKMGDASKRADLLIQAGKFLEAGRIYVKEGLLDKAINVLQDISEESEDFKPAAAALGKIFFEKGMMGVALKKFQQAVRGEAVSNKNIEEYYHIGVVLERTEALKEAAAVYEQVIAANYDYADVATRLHKIQAELSQSKREPARKAELYEPTMVVNTEAAPAIVQHSEQPDRFELNEEIGRGGMGIVYKARDRVLNRVVALKYLPANFAKSDLAVRNFRREAESAAQLSHPGIIVVYDVGYDSRGNYIAMEYLEGHTIKDYIKRKGKLEIRDMFIILRQLAQALDYAHNRKIIHRDIKTSNMMWCKGGTIKIMDFGLAKIMQDVQNSSTQISGTPYYMSPEQTLGLDVDHRTDIYSLGVSLYEMATGVVPFKQGDIGYHQVHTAAPDPVEKNAELPTSLRDIIWKCMEKKPEYRFQSAQELAKVAGQAHAQWREQRDQHKAGV